MNRKQSSGKLKGNRVKYRQKIINFINNEILKKIYKNNAIRKQQNEISVLKPAQFVPREKSGHEPRARKGGSL